MYVSIRPVTSVVRKSFSLKR